jgi:hypothetical protein
MDLISKIQNKIEILNFFENFEISAADVLRVVGGGLVALAIAYCG